MSAQITADQYITLVAAAVNGLIQNPCTTQFAGNYEIANIVSTALEGVANGIQQTGGTIMADKEAV